MRHGGSLSWCSPGRLFHGCLPALPAAVCGLALPGCETLDEFAVGRSDRLRGAPFYVSYERAPVAPGKALALPIAIDERAEEKLTSPDRAAALEPLIDALNEALARHACCTFVYPGEGALPANGPRIYVGSLEGEDAPEDTGIERMSGEEYAPMMLHLDRPSDAWRAAVGELADAEQADRLLVIRLGFSQYPKADQGVFGKKVVLGTSYEEPIRFLSAVDNPVEVVHLTGALVRSDGTVMRAGAEGIAGYDAPFMLQVVDAGRDVTPEAIEFLLTEDRREDLPGYPLKWQAALEQLVFGLLR